MATDTTWLCLGAGVPANNVRSSETHTRPPGPLEGWVPAAGTLEQRQVEQCPLMETDKGVDQKFILTDDSGLIMMKGTCGLTRVYVPRG